MSCGVHSRRIVLLSWTSLGCHGGAAFKCVSEGVAERVAAERGETVGGTVGYQIRLERRACEHTKLLFVTTGILLRRLQADPELEGVTHVILDEV